MTITNLTPTMQRVLDDAEKYADWFSASHHDDAPVNARAQTLKALERLKLLESLTVPTMMNGCKVSTRIYRAKKRLPSQEESSE